MFYSGVSFCTFLIILFVHNTRRLMRQMTMNKNNLTNLSMNLVQLLRTVLDWVDRCVVKDFLYVSHFMPVSHAMVTEGQLHLSE